MARFNANVRPARRIEQTLADVNGVLDQLRRDHQTASADRDRLTAREADLASQLADLQDRRDFLEQAVTDAEAVLRDAQQRHESALAAAATEREEQGARFDRQLSDAATEREGLTRSLTETQAALDDAMTRATRDRLAASKKAAEREAELDGQIQRERTARATIEQTLADVNGVLDQLRRDHQTASADRER
jgi:chromosome segregation ATPase